jgi:proteasome lid subunit RPN8/RPN11
MIQVDPEPWAAMVAHASETYPNECCGAMLGAVEDGRKVVRVALRLPNAFEGSQAARYQLRPEDLIAAERAAREQRMDVVGIYHSHPDHEPSFSPMDRDRALDQAGRPLWPGVLYLVVSVRAGLAGAARGYRWSAQARTFVGTAVPLPERA